MPLTDSAQLRRLIPSCGVGISDEATSNPAQGTTASEPNGPGNVQQLTIQAVSWCWRHGHPVATLVANDGGMPLTISLATDDAQALSPLYRGHGVGRSRTYDLLEGSIAALGGRLIGVLLGAAVDGTPEAALSLESPFGVHTVPAHVADALVMAWRHTLPLRDLRAVMDLAGDAVGTHVTSTSTSTGTSTDSAMSAGTGACDAPLPEAMRAFIDSLDLSGLGGSSH